MSTTERRGIVGGIGALAALALVAACGSGAPAARPTPSVSTSPTVAAPSTGPATPSPSSAPSHSTRPTPAPSPTHATPSRTPSAVPQPVRVRGCPFPAAAPITRAPGVGRTVALTFDDGSSPYTPQILAVLARLQVRATFFDTGLYDTRSPQYARAVLAAGDKIGNHTFDHPRNWGFHAFTPSQQRAELTRTTAVLAPLIGHDPCVMRPPGGAYDASSLALVRSLGMSMVLWSVDTEDWRQPPYLSHPFQLDILRRAEAGARFAHPIILMHAGKASHEPDCAPAGCAAGQVSSFRGNTVAVLPAIIRFYLARGYTFVTL